MSQVRYCLPILATSSIEVEKSIAEQINNYDLIEIWLSLINDLDESFPAKLSTKYPGKYIFVTRHPPLSPSKITFEMQKKIVDRIGNKDAFFDLDIKLQLNEIEKFHNSASLIISYHNFENTPTTDQLVARLEDMKGFTPAIYKIATFCNTPEDALRLLQLGLDCKQKGMRAIILGMGKYGALTRIFGTLWSNDFVYAPLDKALSSAPNQLTKKQLEIIFGEINAGQ